VSYAVNTGTIVYYQTRLSKSNFERTEINNQILKLLEKKTELSEQRSRAYSGKNIKINNGGTSSSLTWETLKNYNNNSSNSPLQLYNVATGEDILEGNQDSSSVAGDLIFKDDNDGSILQTNLLRGVYALKDMDGNVVNIESSDIFSTSYYSDSELSAILAKIETEESRIEEQEQEYELRLNDLDNDISYLEKHIQSIEKQQENDKSFTLNLSS